MAALATVVVLGWSAGSASATVVHKQLSSFSGSATPAGAFFNVWGLSVDNAAGAAEPYVYVSDAVHKVVDKFSAAGGYVCQITGEPGASTKSASECSASTPGVATGAFGVPFGNVVDAGGNLFVADFTNHVVDEFNSEGSYLQGIKVPGLGYVVATAADASGNIFIADEFSKQIDEYHAATKTVTVFAKETPSGPLGTVKGVAVDQSAGAAQGDVYVADESNKVVDVFNAKGEYQTAIEGTPTGAFGSGLFGLASDPTTGDLYVADETNGVVDEFDAAGKFIGDIPLPGGALPTVVAVAAKSKDVYIGDSHQEVLVYGPNLLLPSAVLAPASKFTETSVTLHGEVAPEGAGDVTACAFEYGETVAYGHEAKCTPTTPYTANQEVSAQVTGLDPTTTYHVRLRVTNANGTNYSAGGTFATAGRAAVVDEWAVAGPASAILNVEVAPHEYDTHCRLEYASEAEYSASGYSKATTVPCSPEDLGEGNGEVHAIAHIGGLSMDTTYHYRFVAANRAGKSEGADSTFTTFGFATTPVAALLAEGGTPYSQAGGHPFAYTVEVVFNTTSEPHNAYKNVTGVVKDVRVQLPPGLIGNPDAVEKCAQIDAERGRCSAASEVGSITVQGTKGTEAPENLTGALFEVTPPKGVAARFSGQLNSLANAYIDASVRTGEGYGVEAASLNIYARKPLDRVKVEMWGIPGAAAHSGERYCRLPAGAAEFHYLPPPCAEGEATLPERPFLTLPTSCTGPLTTVVKVDTYQELGSYVTATVPTSTGVTGCAAVPFKPRIAVRPEVTTGDTPTGMSVDLTVPQLESSEGIATADLKDAKVALPAGMTVNPSSANGLVGCPLLSGKGAHLGVSGIDLENGEMANCPNASKVGTVHIKTPLLEEELEGGVYVAQQNANPFKSLLALYIAAEAPERGVVIKLAGHVELNPTTGQLTTTFDENPQLPFSELKLDFFGGERAPLATPRACGTYTTTSLLEPWSHQPAPGEAAGTPNASPESPFSITSGPGGAACDPPAFAPGFAAGTANNHGGSFSPFVMNLTRNDGEQRLSTVAMTLPAGISGMISKVTPCGNAQAEAGDCSAASKIGHVVVQAGVGGEPITLPQPGRGEDPVYLTEKYGGAPFGLSIVVPAQAGPFNLGTVVVRAKILVNPTNAQVSVISNPMPTMLQGIPLDVKAIHVEINRPEFMFNPTDCNATAVAGTIGSAEGASAAVSSHFQAASCAALPFKPKFSALIHARHSRKGGEYLHVVVKSAFGQANIHQVHVQLPGKLPSRLETLKLACTEAQFAANPAGCPAGSFVGHAIAHTPILPVAMQGPAIFVSHGGKGFPNLDLVLQGDGVSITLVGDTYINKKSITTSTFRSVPDVPIGRFDLVLPAGPHSALAGNGNMCAKPLYMPTTLTGQNGAVVKRRTKVQVTGCKPELHVVKARRHGAKATIVVRVPSAGKLVANGAGIGRAVEKAKHATRVSMTVRLKRHVRQMLARRHHRRLKVIVHLRFKPRRGRQIKAHVKLLMR